MIKLNGIYKRYHSGPNTIAALDNINLHVPVGKIMGIVGPSGAGKSTLIRMVNLLERPDQGSIIVDGMNLLHLNRRDLAESRRKIGMIFQQFHLLSSRTVFENIALPLELIGFSKKEIKQRVEELLQLVGLADRAMAYPAELSGGQKQRVGIARALAPSPKVLLCDEATSALDPKTTHSILNLIQEINRKLGLTILLITHEMDVIKTICDEVAILDQGKLVERGKVTSIFSNATTAVARNFINATFHLKIPEEYATRMKPTPCDQSYPLVKLGFTGNTVDKPLISEASRLFNIDISILSADVEYAGGIKFGYLLAELFGTQHQCKAAQQFFIQNNIQLEVLGYVRIND
ncbi:MAG: methionine ABC transporter ATP-binding protein MetN [Verrucomicrobia bacterium]|nr:methionine ABC transporter ATP-binding protein MetN [Verrucomicrobiota bacterium]